MQVCQNSIVSVILNSIAPNSALGAECQGNWPVDAAYAVDYRDHDRQFPQVDHGVSTKYFTSLDEFAAWKRESAEWILGTDYDFSRNYTLYSWDLGPVFMEICNV